MPMQQWRRHLARDLVAWMLPAVGLVMLALASWLGALSLGAMTWLGLSWAVSGWVLFGTFRIRRTLASPPRVEVFGPI